MRSRRNRTKPTPRGVAMLLVIVSLMTATITTTAYLSSRDNSTAIGENGAATTAARWAADSGLDMGIAMLETQTDWRTHAQSNGSAILRNYTLGDALIDVMVNEYGTGAVVGPNTEYVQVTSIGRTNGMEQSVVANAYVPLNPGTIADVDLSEFIIFAANGLAMSERSLITRWPKAPLSGLGMRLQVGTQATSASSIQLANSAAAIDTTVFHGPGTSGALISNSDSPPITTKALLDAIPFPAPAPHGEPAPTLTLTSLTMNGGTATALLTTRYQSAELKNNAVRTLKGSISFITNENLLINSGSKLIIDGNVKIVVFGDLNIDQGSIELKAGARLRLYVRGSGSQPVTIKDGYIGGQRADSTRDTTGNANYIDPQRISIFSDPPSGSPGEWRIESQSVIQGSIYAPHASLIGLRNTSAVYGRIAANAVTMRDDSSVFYDSALDTRTGFTNEESPIYDSDLRMLSAFKTLTSLDTTSLQLVADTTGTIIKSDVGLKISLTGASITPADDEPLPVTEPTPRPVRVQYSMVSFGSSVSTWE